SRITGLDVIGGSRITGLDVTRGFAVMGILLMNIIAFAWPQPVYTTPLAGGGSGPADLAIWAVNYVLVDSKFRGLFSMMFGASALLVIDNAAASERSAARVHFARMGVLALFGLLHFFFIWWGDILFLYAICGMALFLFRDMTARALATTGSILIALHTCFYGASLLAMRTMNSPEIAASYADFVSQFEPGSPAYAKEMALYGGDYASIFMHRFIEIGSHPFSSIAQFGFETLGLMLIGMALFKGGLLAGQWPPERMAMWRNRCLGLGLIANSMLLIWLATNGLDPWAVVMATFVGSVPFNVIMSIGYAALFMGLAQRFAGAEIIARVAAAGRAAFTNYIGTSLLMTSLFYGYGLGLFGEVSRTACYLFVVGAWMIMLLWSKPWLTRFAYGPLEWLWRSLARWQVQPLRKN
ncbi:MAG: DUF418 domain-containing protein, partial [Sphingopyxis sp.]